MLTIYELITFEPQTEHFFEHDLEHKTLYSTPKIYDADGDLSKRWYVYFSYRNPVTGKLERVKKNFYGKANKYKTKEARYSLLGLYKKRLLKLLKDGYSPFEDNTELLQKKAKAANGSTEEKVLPEVTPILKDDDKSIPDEKKILTEEKINISEVTTLPQEESKIIPEETPIPKEETQLKTKESTVPNEAIPEEPLGMEIKEAFDYALNLKTNVVSPRTLRDYRNYCDQFLNWLATNHPEIVHIGGISKKIVTEFLNEKQIQTSARNRNNHRTSLSTIFQTLEDNELVQKNFIKNISILKSKPERNRTYSLQQEEEIFKYLEANDPILLLYIKFISYNFLRPIEVCRLRVQDLNLDEKFLETKVKSQPLKRKIIPEILIQELPDLKGLDGDMLLFTPEVIGAHWDTELTNRRNYFSKRFKLTVKKHFGLGKNFGLYSFRHTFITKLYRALSNESSPYAAKSELMHITGHSTMTALEKYLRDLDAEMPNDYSKYFK